MNPLGADVAGWFFQQDYMTFLAVLGWLTAGLVAWGNAAAAQDSRRIPWRWFAFFAFFASLDSTLDLARMVTPEIWPQEIHPLFRLAGYGCLLELARRGAGHLRWVRVGPLVPIAIPVAGLAAAFYAPEWSPIPETIVAVLASVSAAVVISAQVDKGTRPLLATAAALLLVGGGELLRGQGGVAIDGLYGLLVTGEGFGTALFSAVLAWVASAGLWIHGVLRQRGGPRAAAPESRGLLAPLLLPVVIGATLVGGYFLVNASSSRVREAIERDHLFHVRTAALAIDPEALDLAWSDPGSAGREQAIERVRRQVAALRAVADELVRVYVWGIAGEVVLLPPEWIAVSQRSQMALENPVVRLVGLKALQERGGGAHLLGPIGSRSASVLLANAPILDPSSRQQNGWLGMEISARVWLTAQASARLQTIALVGLFASLIVFFLAHQMLREYEGELVVAKERAEAADRAKDEFLAVMSHEMRTPMQSVLGYGELLARTPLNEVQSGYLDTIRNQGRTLLRIVQDILDFAVLRKSSYTLKSEDIYLHRLVESAFDSVKPLASRKGLSIDLSIGSGVPEMVRGDGVRIEQILLNLLGNAVKFTDSGGVRLKVRLKVAETGDADDRTTVVFSVIDTGSGIRAADQKRLFEPFTRLNPAEGVPKEGAGLGLAIVKRLCQLMGGDVELVSEWGMGTQFSVYLPLEVIAAHAGPEAAAADAGSALEQRGEPVELARELPLRILVADDNPFIRRLMMEYLHSLGYGPVSVSNGAEAVARWREFDLLMMDLRMPGMDGVVASGHIRAQSGHPEEPWIIGVSATLSEEEIERAMKAGMNDFLGKPFFVQSLVEAIKASPLYERRGDVPAAPAPAAAAEEFTAGAEEAPAPPPSAPSGVMSWMPDLGANGGSALVDRAIAEVPEVLGEIETALAAGDFEVVGERAHYLKNTIFALRMDPLVAPCRRVSDGAAALDAAATRGALADLGGAFAEWRAARR